MNKKVLTIGIVSAIVMFSTTAVFSLKINGNNLSRSYAQCDIGKHNGFHYNKIDASELESGHEEFWTCCFCHQSWLDNPGGTFLEGNDSTMLGGLYEDHIAYIPPKGTHTHDFSLQNASPKYLALESSCEEAAKYYYSCECGQAGTLTFEYGEPLGHNHGAFISNNDATCQHNGTKSATCSRCGHVLTVTDEGTKLNHSFVNKNTDEKFLKIKGDCQHESVYYYSCDCGEHSLDTFTTGTLGEHHFANPTLYGLDKVKKTCTLCGKTLIEDRYKTISIDATNDYHGAITKDFIGNNVAFPLDAFGSYFKQESSKENTLLIDAGDTWKGPIESTLNYGQMVNEVMNYAHFDARLTGNHDYDWGLDVLKANTAASYNGYSTPVLASNVFDYNWETKQIGSIHQDDIGREYVTYTLENGLKVGIVGIISEDQIELICQNLVHDIGFKNSIDVAKSLSDYLRTEQGCDIVIVVSHDGVQEMKRIGSSLADVSKVSNKKYADLVLCSHTHNFETDIINGVLFEQCDESGISFRKIDLEYDALTDEIYDFSHETVFGSAITKSVQIDSNVQAIINKYMPAVNSKKAEIVNNNISNQFSKDQATNLLAKSLFDEARNEGHLVSYSLVYKASSGINSGALTYGELFNTFRFNHIPYVLDVKGSDIINLFTNQPTNDFVDLGLYRGTDPISLNAIDPSRTYKIVALDKIAFHVSFTTGGARSYNYFPTLKVDDYLKNNGEPYLYRDVVADYLKSITGSVSNADYEGNHFNKDLLSQNIA